MGNSEHREEAGSSVQGKRCNHNPPGFSVNVAFFRFFSFPLFFFFWSNAALFEVTTKDIKEREISALYWNCRKQVGATCRGPTAFSLGAAEFLESKSAGCLRPCL